jgi:hypothetical protein
MKKIMIIAAVALCAFCSQAASYRWSASGVKDSTGAAAYTGTATLYAFLASEDSSKAFAVDTGAMNNGSIALKAFSNDSFVVGQQYTFYYTMEDATGNVFTSGTKTAAAQNSALPVLGFGNTGSWSASDVPEPTSGLLLLVGVAGLALRRRKL